ncbi:MAG: hypothetical protein WCA49_22270 [Candidatus Sulfotelmatobacter sp.]
MNRFSLPKPPKALAIVMLLIAGLCVFSIFASAQAAPTAGYDLLTTGAGASVDLTSIGLGVVPLQGVPIESSLGEADTIMHRPGNTTFGQAQTLLVTALFMKSTNSVVFEGKNADVYITLNNSAGVIPTSVLPQPDTLNASGGTVTINSGGTFTSNFVMNADVILVNAGTSVTNPSNYIAHQASPQVSFTPAASTWATAAPSGYPYSTTFPSGGFYPIKPVHTGPHPVTYATCGSSGSVKSQALRVACITQPEQQ